MGAAESSTAGGDTHATCLVVPPTARPALASLLPELALVTPIDPHEMVPAPATAPPTRVVILAYEDKDEACLASKSARREWPHAFIVVWHEAATEDAMFRQVTHARARTCTRYAHEQVRTRTHARTYTHLHARACTYTRTHIHRHVSVAATT